MRRVAARLQLPLLLMMIVIVIVPVLSAGAGKEGSSSRRRRWGVGVVGVGGGGRTRCRRCRGAGGERDGVPAGAVGGAVRGVAEACGRGGPRPEPLLPRAGGLAFAAHARSALEVARSSAAAGGVGRGPMMPDDNQLSGAWTRWAGAGAAADPAGRPNATCDAVICFCGIRLHQITSLRCPAAFDLPPPRRRQWCTSSNSSSGGGVGGFPQRHAHAGRARPRAQLPQRLLRRLHPLHPVPAKGEGAGGGGGMEEERGRWMMGRDCQLMGLTWLLARNKTAFIPTVSAVLRAMLYTTHPPSSAAKCSPDQENMPLAVDSLQFQHLNSADDSIAAAAANRFPFFSTPFWASSLLLYCCSPARRGDILIRIERRPPPCV
uniref:Uncharacterized protein n=1 Tax=Ananas comosus var. bracteatus TaxID=296719 RepID=A0A6V7NL37_ANACO|nr:unnamed protein product [Ananas comosus var. bracteatus]